MSHNENSLITIKGRKKPVPLSEILENPFDYFPHPNDLISAETPEREIKLQILEQMEEEVRALMVASEENMQGSLPSDLPAIHKAREALGATQEFKEREDAPTKA